MGLHQLEPTCQLTVNVSDRSRTGDDCGLEQAAETCSWLLCRVSVTGVDRCESRLPQAAFNMPALTFTTHWAALAALATFVVAYGVAMAEERLHVRKSVPVLLAAAVALGFVASVGAQQ